jgi:hypothetical protein
MPRSDTRSMEIKLHTSFYARDGSERPNFGFCYFHLKATSSSSRYDKGEINHYTPTGK